MTQILNKGKTMTLTLKEMEYIADNFESGCCGEYISIQIFDGNVAALTCPGDGSEFHPDEHKLDGNTFNPKTVPNTSA